MKYKIESRQYDLKAIEPRSLNGVSGPPLSFFRLAIVYASEIRVLPNPYRWNCGKTTMHAIIFTVVNLSTEKKPTISILQLFGSLGSEPISYLAIT